MLTQHEKHIFFWLIFLTLLALFMGAVADILLPFVVGMLVAYFLDPAADKLQKNGFSRAMATTVITLSFFSLVGLMIAVLLPLIYDQMVSFAAKVPDYIQRFQSQYGEHVQAFFARIDPGLSEDMQGKLTEFSGQAVKYAGGIAAGVWESGMAFFNLLSLIFLSPVVAFYMLRDYDLMKEKVNGWLPRKHAPTIRRLLKEMDAILSGYIRGVSNVCLFLGVFYATGLSLIGLEFGLLIGLGAGLISFIPFVGNIIGMITALTVAFFQFDGAMAQMGMVLAVFLLGQVLEGNVVTPMLVGDKVNLHAVWMIFGLLAGGSLLGFTGVVLAVPVTAVLGVLVRFAIGEYLKSEFYKEGVESTRKKARSKP